MNRILKIKDKLIIITISTILLAIGFNTYFNLKDFIAVYRGVMIERVFAQSTELRNMIEDVIELGLDLGELTGLEKECRKLVHAIPYAKYCYVMDINGRVLYHNNLSEMGLIYADPYTKRAVRAEKRMIQYVKINSRLRLYDFSLPVYGTAKTRIGYIRIGIKSEVIDNQVSILIGRAVLLGVSAIFLASIAIFIMTKISILEPLNNLLKGIKNFSKGDFKYRINLRTRDELLDLSEAFNHMAGEIQELLDSEKELTQLAEAKAKAEQDKATELAAAYRKLEDMQDSLVQVEKFNATGKLASGVAHEVKNPLGAILANIEYIEVTTSKDDKEKLKAIAAIKENIKRATNIIDDLVTFSHASKLTKVPVRINDVIKKALSMVSHQCARSQIKICADFKEDLPKVNLDIEKMEQVFVNLFLNAMQAMGPGGVLTVRSYTAKMPKKLKTKGISESQKIKVGQDVLFVEVEDTGEGIDRNNLPRIFDPFFTTKPTGQGTGLGLSVTSNIIKMHDGEISISSTEKVGTKITIVFYYN